MAKATTFFVAQKVLIPYITRTPVRNGKVVEDNPVLMWRISILAPMFGCKTKIYFSVHRIVYQAATTNPGGRSLTTNAIGKVFFDFSQNMALRDVRNDNYSIFNPKPVNH